MFTQVGKHFQSLTHCIIAIIGNQWQWVEHLSVLHGGSLEFFLQTKSIQGFLDYFDVYDLVLLEIPGGVVYFHYFGA